MAGELTLKANPVNLETGATSTLTAAVADTNGDPMEGVDVSLVATGGSLGSGTVTTGADGTATTTFTSDAAGAIEVTAGAEGFSAKVTVTFTEPEEPEEPEDP